jgi:hypothetical protein
VAFEKGAGVFEVLFGVGAGLGDALKCFVQDADDPPLFGERGYGNGKVVNVILAEPGLGGTENARVILGHITPRKRRDAAEEK